MPKISALPVATPANLTGPAILPTTDKNTLTVGTTYAQLRTALFAQGTGYATTDILALGTTPGTTAAINVDAGVYSDIALNVKSANGTRSVRLIVANNNIAFGDTSGNFFNLMANNLNKWTISPDAAGTATLTSAETTARIVGGSVNGLAIRNSGNTVDNLQMTDAGNLIIKAASGALVQTATALTNNAAAQIATITNGPTAGNPTKWIPINDNGTVRNIPVW